ncbi:hypothetical protein [Alkaliphilus sp. B6464]|uniref:hypothetical protein n=1 Tax=Alkaliphilus sp. B6464 TaxID=2731219 RepID=UPI001BA6B4FA|nr:hypothetical protein [Alkaliphilus sp. B6464]QUH21814.1 hypothetical protein HYG84_17920 [Alkaliphilus sp. B6464]
MKTKWNFNEEDFNKAIKGVIEQDASEDFLGNLYIGHLSFDLKLMDYEDEIGVVLDADLYIGGIDSGYGYTSINNLPYDNDGGFQVLNKQNVNDFQSFYDFKQYLERKAVDYIIKENNGVYIKKMNMDNIFDWS